MDDKRELLDKVIATIAIHDQEIANLGEAFDYMDRYQDMECLQAMRELSRDAGDRLSADGPAGDDQRDKREIVSDMLLLFGANHVRSRMAKNIVEALREEIKEANDDDS